ncbi:RecB family exonuclease [Aeromicrobium sp. CTD01-1L150]|uniref:RecB family exonuclease n=1 Tax=Aeromicrobium sp. CTD01-1L150 TaxID=3341830 RepID=UPI0035C0F9E2
MNTAPTIEPVRVRRALSPSRASDFLSCPLKYRYRTIDRLPEEPDRVAARGTLVHSVLEELFDAEASERTLERARSLLEPQWRQLLEDDPRLAGLFTAEQAAEQAEWLSSCHPLLESYFSLEDPRWLEPAERELRVDHVLESGLGLGGVVDRLDIAPDGRIRVVDYKSGRSPSERFEDKALFQMRFYALVIWRTRGVLPTLLQLMYLGDRTVLHYEPTESELLATERKLQALWDAISQALETGEFVPRRSALCRWCSYQEVCPEWGGQAPVMPPLAVVDPTPSDQA